MIDISQLAKRTGQAASTLRYYEERGLIESVGRRGLKRVFDDTVLDRLALIALGRAAGFSLDEIAEMFSGAPSGGIDRSKLLEKADELDRQIEQLRIIRDGLRHTSKCTAPSHLECSGFRRVMKAAGYGLIPALERTPKRSA